MSVYHRSQLTSSNGHVTGIDSPIPDSPPVADPNRYESRIQNLAEEGLDAIEKYEARLRAVKINCCMDIDARETGFWMCEQARKRLAAQQTSIR